MTEKKLNDPKVLRARMYKAFIEYAEARAELKIAERDEVKLERPVIFDEHNMSREGAEPCTAQEFVDQFNKQLDIMAQAFPEEGEELRSKFESMGQAKVVGKLGRFVADMKDHVKTLWDKSWEKEFAFEDRVREYQDAGEMTYIYLLDLKLDKLPEADRNRVLADLKVGGALHKSLSDCEDIPAFYALPEGLIAYNENKYEDGAPVYSRVVEYFEESGIDLKHFLGGPAREQEPYGCDVKLITTDGAFPSPELESEPNPEQWLPKLKEQVMSLYKSASKDQDVRVEPD